jgi:DNA-binding NarL/FixJ family response regulator
MARVGNLNSLTSRERQVFSLLIAGRVLKEVAQELNISYRTTKEHSWLLLKKLGCSSRNELLLKFRPPDFQELLLLADLVGRVTALENKVKELEANA